MVKTEASTICRHLIREHGGQVAFGSAQFETPGGIVYKGNEGKCLSGCGHTCEKTMAEIGQLHGKDVVIINPTHPIEPKPLNQ